MKFSNYNDQQNYLDQFKVYWNYRGGQRWSTYPDMGGKKRIVNQKEILEFIRVNPGYSESEIMDELYDFVRGGIFSNKKYAECLRRLLRTKKIGRGKSTDKYGGRKSIFRYYINTDLVTQ